jgi:hypothetical protein
MGQQTPNGIAHSRTVLTCSISNMLKATSPYHSGYGLRRIVLIMEVYHAPPLSNLPDLFFMGEASIPLKEVLNKGAVEKSLALQGRTALSHVRGELTVFVELCSVDV